MSMPKQPPRPQHFENVLQCYSFRTKILEGERGAPKDPGQTDSQGPTFENKY
jgi:hypothetical protein